MKESETLSLAKIVKCGDVMQDAAIYYTKLAQKPEMDLPEEIHSQLQFIAQKTQMIRID